MDRDRIKEIAENTPLHIFDLDRLSERTAGIRSILGNTDLCFAIKANPFLTKELSRLTDRLEVCSPGEFEICDRLGIPPEKLIISGVNKSIESMERILSATGGKSIYTLESRMQYDIISDICKRNDMHVKVIARLTSGNQFGMTGEVLKEILGKLPGNRHLELIGLHYYSGTQKKPSKMEKELGALSEYAAEIKAEFGMNSLELEYGPGLSFDYFSESPAPDEFSDLELLKSYIETVRNYDKITVEMGRYLTSDCGYYVTSVADIKQNDGHNYCIVDGGIHQLNYYGQLMGMKKPHVEVIAADSGDPGMKWNVCGSLCTVSDVIMKEACLGELKVGDMLVFKDCGAYSVTEGMSMFLSRNLPEVMFYSEKDGAYMVRSDKDTYSLNIPEII